MFSHVCRHPSRPALIRVYEASYDMKQSMQPSLEDIALMDAHPRKIYYISDVRQMAMTFDDILAGANAMGKTEIGQKKFHHPNVIENLGIVKQRIIELTAQNLKMPSLGSVQLK